jgi:hypothetical protein
MWAGSGRGGQDVAARSAARGYVGITQDDSAFPAAFYAVGMAANAYAHSR